VVYGVEGVNEAGRAAGIAGGEWARPRGHEGSAGRMVGRGRSIVVSRRPRTVNDTNRDGRVRRARVCGERVRRASGAQGHAGERASERASDRGEVP
jgi:hypothetical protein